MAYKNIHDNFWRDPDVRALPNDERLFLLYAITNPQSHMSGIYYLPMPLIVHETGWDDALIKRCIDTLSIGYRYGIDTVSVGYGIGYGIGYRKGIDRVSSTEINISNKFFLIYDSATHLIWVRNMLRYQVYMKKVSPKIVTAVSNHLIGLPFCPLVELYSRYYAGLRLPFFDPSTIPYPTKSVSASESTSESVISEGQNLPDPISKRLRRLCDQLSGNGFNPISFTHKAYKSGIPFEVVETVLERIVRYKDSIDNKWGYAIDVLKKEYGNYNYAQEIARHNKLKHEPVNLETLFEKIKVVD